MHQPQNWKMIESQPPKVGALPSGLKISDKVDNQPVEEKIEVEAEKVLGKPHGEIPGVRPSKPTPLQREKGFKQNPLHKEVPVKPGNLAPQNAPPPVPPGAQAGALNSPPGAAQHRAENYKEKIIPLKSSGIMTGLVEGFKNSPNASVKEVRPLMEEFLEMALSAKSGRVTSNAHLKSLLDTLTSTPQAQKLLKSSSSFKKQHRSLEARLSPQSSSNVTLDSKHVSLQIAKGNREVADFAKLPIEKLAPSLANEMSMLQGGVEPKFGQARANILDYTLSKVNSMKELSGEERASFVMDMLNLATSAEAEGLPQGAELRAVLVSKFPYLVQARTALPNLNAEQLSQLETEADAKVAELKAQTHENAVNNLMRSQLAKTDLSQTLEDLSTEQLKSLETDTRKAIINNSVQQFISLMVSPQKSPQQQEAKEAFIMAGHSMGWGKDDLKGVHIFEQFHVVYPKLTPLEQKNVMELVADYVNTGASLPAKAGDQNILKGHLHTLLALGPHHLDHDTFVKLSNYIASPSKDLIQPQVPPEKDPRSTDELLQLTKTNYQSSPYKMTEKNADSIYRDMAAMREKAFTELSLTEFDVGTGPGITKFTDQFNQMSSFLIDQVLLCSDKDRASVVSKLVQVADLAVQNNRFDVALIVVSALSHSSVGRLRLEGKISPEQNARLKVIEDIVGPRDTNQKALRSGLKTAKENGAPALPLVSTILKDLTFTRDGNKPVLPASEDNPLGTFNSGSLLIYAQNKRGIKDFKDGLIQNPTQGTPDQDQLAQLISQPRPGGEDVQYQRSYEILPRRK